MSYSCEMMLEKRAIIMIVILSLNFTQLSGIAILSESSEAGRVLAEQSTDNSDGTVRVDPSENLRKYRGGYNITNVHYWSSTTFTSIYGVSTAALWLLCGLIYGIFALVRATCCNNSRNTENESHCNNYGYSIFIVLVVIFTLQAIAACGMVFGGNKMFCSRGHKMVDVVSRTATMATDKIHLVSGAFKNINCSLMQVGSSNQATDFLRSTSKELDSRAAVLQTKAPDITHLTKKGLDIVYSILTWTVSLILISVIALLAFGVLKVRSIVYILITVCWIFVVLSWLFVGVYSFFYSLAGDTCTALDSFQKDPYNSSLSAVLPCDELWSAKPVLTNVGMGIHHSVDQVNKNISASYGAIVQICNPFSPPPTYAYEPWNCSPSSTRIGDIPHVLRAVACPDDEVEVCKGGIAIHGAYFRMVVAYSESVQQLLDVFPTMEYIVECKIIMDAFSEILHKHCKPLRRSLHMIWGSFISLSIVMMVLIIIWIVGAHRHQNHHPSGGSVEP